MKVHIWGEVQKPGLYEVKDNTDLIELISNSGGPTEYADLRAVSLSRINHVGREIEKVNVMHILKSNGSGDLAPILKPGDTVLVPRNSTYTWRAFIRTFSEVAVIASTYILIYDRVK
ncbi:MAG: SLBB domain-containing protein [Candidatus Eisenbacteria bacterium]